MGDSSTVGRHYLSTCLRVHGGGGREDGSGGAHQSVSCWLSCVTTCLLWKQVSAHKVPNYHCCPLVAKHLLCAETSQRRSAAEALSLPLNVRRCAGFYRQRNNSEISQSPISYNILQATKITPLEAQLISQALPTYYSGTHEWAPKERKHLSDKSFEESRGRKKKKIHSITSGLI